MIGKLTGLLDYKAADHVLIEAGGVGYVVHCAERTLAALPAPGERVALFTELVVREDLMQLFGFATLAEREWHRLLMGVQGVGARAALSILGALGTEGLARAVSLGDVAAIRRAPGIGPKIAERVARELRGKAPALMAMGAAGARPATASAAAEPPPGPAQTGRAAAMAGEAARPEADAQDAADALSALVNLGYAPGEAASALAEAEAAAPGAGMQALLREALRRLAPRG
jgi:Holliday junction DNA helicase RuvA